jgi:diguanylate cyclase (GGDEF)-like protein
VLALAPALAHIGRRSAGDDAMTFRLDMDLHLNGSDGDFRPATDFARWAESTQFPPDFVASEAGPLTPPPKLFDVTVMIADKNPRMTEVIRQRLQTEGFKNFVTVHDPQWVLDSARRHRPGLLLLDMEMPGLSGFDLLDGIRADEALRYVPVLGMAESADAAFKLKALQLGAVEVLQKPLNGGELVLRVRNSLNQKVYQDRLANEDALTGLPNRRVFQEHLRTVLREMPNSRRFVALLHIGLDRFRQINDGFGDKAGDQLLGAVAHRLQSCMRRGDGLVGRRQSDVPMLSRLGGDEFALLLPEIAAAEIAGRLARRILSAMSRPFQHEGRDVFITPSIGIAVAPTDGQDEEALRRNAAAALVHAKSNGRNTFHFFSIELNNAAGEKLALEMRLRRAIEREELLLHFQPKVDVESGRMVGAEALLRWKHPDLGLVPPDQFIPLAEQTGLIVEIGQWVADRVCAQLARWRASDQPEIKVAINVSRQEIVAGGFVPMLSAAIQRHNIKPAQLVVELTEGMLMDRVDQTRQQLDALRALGVEISIDDFGTGFSSMSYLKRFPLDELKIDKSFISGTPSDTTDVAIVRAIIALAHSLDLRVVAEGVETEAQRAELQALGCDQFQGYLCSRPLPAASFIARAREINGLPDEPSLARPQLIR